MAHSLKTFASAPNMTKISSSLLLLGLLCLSSSLLPVLNADEGENPYLIFDYPPDHLLSEERILALFEIWAARHSKSYGAKERVHRLSAFRDNLEYIIAHNSRQPAPDFTLGLNRFADLTNEEHRARYVGSRLDQDARAQRRLQNPKITEFRYKDVEAPASVDWREKGAVAAVKDQGNCASCWSFSAIAAIEGINYLATGELVALSAQELVDCDTSYNQGCVGGMMDYAFEFVIQNGGINSEADYPYTASQGKCDTSKMNAHVVTIDGYEDVPYNNEGALLQALAKQPVSIAIDSGGRDFQLYTSGVFTGSCGVQLDHGVVAVGYGTDNGKDYWIVRNSWGGHWGESGYIRMQRSTGEPNGTCGILIEPSYPTKIDTNLLNSSIENTVTDQMGTLTRVPLPPH